MFPDETTFQNYMYLMCFHAKVSTNELKLKKSKLNLFLGTTMIFYQTQINQIDVNFHLQKSLEILKKIQLTKFDPKRTSVPSRAKYG